MYMKTLYSALHTPVLTVVLLMTFMMVISSMCILLLDIIMTSHLLSTVSKQTHHFRTMLNCTSTGPGLTMRESTVSFTIIIIIYYGQNSLSMSTVSYVYMSVVNQNVVYNYTVYYCNVFCDWKIFVGRPNLTLCDLARIVMLFYNNCLL